MRYLWRIMIIKLQKWASRVLPFLAMVIENRCWIITRIKNDPISIIRESSLKSRRRMYRREQPGQGPCDAIEFVIEKRNLCRKLRSIIERDDPYLGRCSSRPFAPGHASHLITGFESQSFYRRMYACWFRILYITQLNPVSGDWSTWSIDEIACNVYVPQFHVLSIDRRLLCEQSHVFFQLTDTWPGI